jgi:hypothetical protein
VFDLYWSSQMKKSRSVAVTAVAAVSMAIACSEQRSTTARVCVDQGNKVVPAQQCERHAGPGVLPYFWYYHAGYARGAYPATGSIVHSGGRITTTTGAPVSRGGFGATAGGRSVSS